MRYRIRILLPGSTRTRLFREQLSGEATGGERIGVVLIRWEAAFVALLLVLLGLPVISLGADTIPFAANPDAVEDGRVLHFGSGCAPCHDPVGEGAVGPSMLDHDRVGIVQR